MAAFTSSNRGVQRQADIQHDGEFSGKGIPSLPFVRFTRPKVGILATQAVTPLATTPAASHTKIQPKIGPRLHGGPPGPQSMEHVKHQSLARQERPRTTSRRGDQGLSQTLSPSQPSTLTATVCVSQRQIFERQKHQQEQQPSLVVGSSSPRPKSLSPGRFAAMQAMPHGIPEPPLLPPPLSAFPLPCSVANPRSELCCMRYGACSGCSLQDGLSTPPLYGEAVGVFRRMGLNGALPAVMLAPHGWRCRAKLSVRGPVGRPLIGLFREDSHEVVDIVGPAPLSRGSTTLESSAAAVATHISKPTGDPVAAAISHLDAGDGIGIWSRGEESRSCRVHHPRINQAAELIKELVTQLHIAPYNEPAPTRTRAGASATTSTSTPHSTARGTIPRRRPPGVGNQGQLYHANGRSGPQVARDTTLGLLRYLQLTAVPSQPGGRAEDDHAAAVQVVLVLNAPSDCDLHDPRVAPALELCRQLWRIAGPGGPCTPSDTTPQSVLSRPPSAASPQRSQPQSQTGRQGRQEAHSHNRPLVHSLWLNFQPDTASNTILGKGWRHVAGPTAAWQEFGGAAACVGPGSFVQANYGAMQRVLQDIAEMVPPGSRVTELHAGIGVIGLSLVANARLQLAALRCVEVNPAAAEPFRASLELLRQRWRMRHPFPEVEYVTAEAGSDPHRFLADCDVLIVDPPRKGLGQSLLTALTRAAPNPGAVLAAGITTTDDASAVSVSEQRAAPPLLSRLVYLSCGFRALQGDLAVLLAGGWRLRSATAHIFFPGTNSLETLVLLTREE